MKSRVSIQERVWYRFLQVGRLLAYLFFAGIALLGAQGHEAYVYTDYFTGETFAHPSTPFNWNWAIGTMFIGWIVVEGARHIIIYLATGQSLLDGSTTTHNTPRRRDDDELEDWDKIKNT